MWLPILMTNRQLPVWLAAESRKPTHNCNCTIDLLKEPSLAALAEELSSVSLSSLQQAQRHQMKDQVCTYQILNLI